MARSSFQAGVTGSRASPGRSLDPRLKPRACGSGLVTMGSDRAGTADPRSFDRFAAGYDRYVSLEPAGLPRWLLDHLPTRRGRALDAGCGSGRHTLALAD